MKKSLYLVVLQREKESGQRKREIGWGLVKYG
jgi:hypothetical protein